MRLLEEGLDRRLVLSRISWFHGAHANLVLQECAKVEHLLGETVERLSDTRLEVSQPLVRSRHVLVVGREICFGVRRVIAMGYSPSTRFLPLATRRSICPNPSSNRSRPSLMSTNLVSGFLTREKTLTSVSDSESMMELWDSGGGFARCLCFATFFTCQLTAGSVAVTPAPHCAARHRHTQLTHCSDWRKSATRVLRCKVG